MAQISKGETFSDGQQVTGARLNQLVDSSVLLVGAITDQSSLPAATVAADDQMILSDTSTAVLKKTSVGDILGSSLPIVATSITGTSVTTATVTTPVINASANSDIIVTTYDGINVTGKPFNSPDGITTTVSSVGHGLPTGSVVQITASNTAYSGVFKITSLNANEFTYTISPAVPLASGTCSYIRKGTTRVNGNQTISGNQIIAGNQLIEGDLNVTGTLKINGTLGYVLYEVSEVLLPSTAYIQGGSQTTTAFTTATIPSKPADEIWQFKCGFYYTCNGYPYKTGIRYSTQSAVTGSYLGVVSYQDAGGPSAYTINKFEQEWTIASGVALAAFALCVDVYTQSGQNSWTFLQTTGQDGIGGWTGALPSQKILIYKYKTA